MFQDISELGLNICDTMNGEGGKRFHMIDMNKKKDPMQCSIFCLEIFITCKVDVSDSIKFIFLTV